jgi:ATP-dependent DNA ligase
LIPKDHPRLQYVDHIETQGEILCKYAQSIGMEGIMAKKADSQYVGTRSKDWLKMKPADGMMDGRGRKENASWHAANDATVASRKVPVATP